MANEPIDIIMPVLREMRGEIQVQFAEVRQGLDRMEDGQKDIRKALTADTLMSKLLTANFDGRISELESQVAGLMRSD